MNPNTGEIVHLTDEQIKEMYVEHQENTLSRMDKENRSSRMYSLEKKLVAITDEEEKELDPLSKKERKGWMRNKPCPCNSGKKFKKCCWSKFT